MRDIAEYALQAALDAGAAYADARVQEVDTEEVSVRNGVLETAEQATSAGVGIRVLVDGAWGFAATSELEGDNPAAAAGLDPRRPPSLPPARRGGGGGAPPPPGAPRLPRRHDVRHPRRLAGRPPDSRVHRPSDRARPHPRRRGCLRRHLVPQPLGP